MRKINKLRGLSIWAEHNFGSGHKIKIFIWYMTYVYLYDICTYVYLVHVYKEIYRYVISSAAHPTENVTELWNEYTK